MSLARARAAQGLRNGLRQSYARPAVRPNTFRRAAQVEAKRHASSGGEHKRSSDLPWLITAVVVTVPSCYYLWPAPHTDDHHHDSHEKHEESEDEAADDDSSDDKSEEKQKAKSDDKSEKKQDSKADEDSEEEESGDGDEKSKPNKKGGDSDVEGVKFKGKLKPDSDGAEHTSKVESDSKGANKKRLDSGLRKDLGPPSDQGDSTSTSGKQDGLANTQSRHSIPIHEHDDKSKKPDGTPETSKHIGTVDPAKK